MDDQEKNLREFGFSALIQGAFGLFFFLFGVGLLVFRYFLNKNIDNSYYFEFIFMALLMLIVVMPFTYWAGKYHIGNKIREWDTSKPDLKFMLTILFILWVLRELEFKDFLINFMKGNEIASVFFIALPLITILTRRTSFPFVTGFFILSTLLLHKIFSEVSLTQVGIFYIITSGVFIFGGLRDFRKFKKISNSP